MEKHPLVITGSARKNGDTHQLVTQLFAGKQSSTLDLLDYTIAPYSYSGDYPVNDQFNEVVQEMLGFTTIIFATPVYWYAMSGAMKTFFDRLTDLVTINKKIGRQMKGKRIFLLAIGAEDLLPVGFEVPFALTSAYFEMEYQGCYYCRTKETETLQGKDSFLEKVYA